MTRSTDSSKPRAPSGLKSRGRRFWRDTVAEFELSEGELALLTEVCRTLDTLDTLNGVIVADGATTTGSQEQIVMHPAVGEARQQRLALHRLLAALELPDEDGSAVPGARVIGGRENARSQWAGRVTEAAARRAEKEGA